MDAYKKDLGRQHTEIKNFVAPKPLSDVNIRKTVFTGSGDSLAAAMLAEALSDYSSLAADPLEILRNPQIVKNKNLYVISVSGRTITNIRLLQNRVSAHITAITANKDSELAKLADDTIPLEFPSSDILTAGSISFLNSALVCMALIQPLNLDNAVQIMERAKRDACNLHQNGRTFFVGNQHTFPVAMYAAAKTYEIHGTYANYSRTEQFAHMELFSAKRGDTVILFENSNKQNGILSESLNSKGIRCTVTDPNISDPVESILYHVAYAQYLPLNDAERDDVYFMKEDTLRGISDAAIY